MAAMAINKSTLYVTSLLETFMAYGLVIQVHGNPHFEEEGVDRVIG